MAAPAQDRRYTYADLEAFPDDNVRREIIDGELFVSPSPIPRHQEVADELCLELRLWTRAHGGRANTAPLDVYFTEHDVVEPDVLFLSPESMERIGPKNIQGPPDIVVEVSSPSTRRLELVRKLDLYERHGVAEYWYVDLEADRIEVYRRQGAPVSEHSERRYGAHETERFSPPVLLTRDDTLTSPLLDGFAVDVDALLGEAET